MYYYASSVLSIMTVWVIWQAGNYHKHAWLVGVVEKTLWLGLVIIFAKWVLLPITLARLGAYARNWLKWRREAKEAEQPGGVHVDNNLTLVVDSKEKTKTTGSFGYL